MTPCYAEDHFHHKRLIMFAVMFLFTIGVILYGCIGVATAHEIEELYSMIFKAIAFLFIGAFFYITRIPESYLSTCFGKKKSSRWIREKI